MKKIDVGFPGSCRQRESKRCRGGLVMSRVLFIVAGLSFSLLSPTSAHHSPTAFDMSQVVEFAGTVVRFDWRNPHVYLTVEDSDNVEWVIETDATALLTRSGWTRDSFAPGDSVSVRARPHRNSDRTHGLLLSIEGPDGVSMSSLNRIDRSDNSRPVATTTDLSGIWQAELLPATNSVRLPLFAELAAHPLTEKGEAVKANYSESITPTGECIGIPTPTLLSLTAPYLGEFELRDEVIMFRSEFYDTERPIYMDGRGHPENGERTIQGHSVGSWEGDTLVVDTRLFADHRSPYGVGVPSGAQKHVVERYTLSEDGAQLLVDVFLEDPEYLAGPFTGSLVLNYSPHLEMISVDCDPEVARRFTQVE